MENFKNRERYNIESQEFQAEFREKIAERLHTYPLEKAGHSDLPDKVKIIDVKFPIDSWVGDAFAYVAREKYALREEEYEELRKIIFID